MGLGSGESVHIRCNSGCLVKKTSMKSPIDDKLLLLRVIFLHDAKLRDIDDGESWPTSRACFQDKERVQPGTPQREQQRKKGKQRALL